MGRPEGGTPKWLRISLLVVLYAGLLAGGNMGSGWLTESFREEFAAAVQSHEAHIMMAGILVFAVFMAVPFVPGIEISLALLATFGSKMVIAVYAATVLALSLSWWIGTLLPFHVIVRFFDALGFKRARDLVEGLETLDSARRLERLVEHAPKRIVPVLLRHRYVAIICALNVPGNAVVGGGGGIALLAGLSGLFRFPLFLAAVSLAALPIPLIILLTDR